MSLTRRTPLRPKPKGKGNRGERAIVDMCHDHGWTHARRNFASGGQGGADIINGPPGVSLEVKWCEQARIWQWIAQCEKAARPTEIPAVIFKRNLSAWWACCPSDEWDALDALWNRSRFVVVRESEKVTLWPWIERAVQSSPVLSLSAVARVQFKRASSGWYTAGPALEFFHLLKLREAA
jgi:hypothetical protein